MFTTIQAQTTTFENFGTKQDEQAEARRIAGKLFDQAYGRGKRSQWMAKLTRKENELQSLAHRSEAARRVVGTIVVPLTKIVGSEGRSEDFDAAFNPLKKHNRERWIGVAAARWTGVVLPAVELVQVGDEFYVRDGHHRISVAKALGQLEIDARVVN
jgi:hypothetical protein